MTTTANASSAGQGSPAVSVIIPARNEELSLGRCLESLVAQQGVGFEVLVVDDGSTDRTRAIAESFAQVQVLDAGALPAGWTGKNHACWQGAQRARGRWLLFTDADTAHAAGSLAAAVVEAEQNGAAMLSYSPRQEVGSFWERILLPVVFAELAAAYPPKEVSDPKSPVAAANGQYLLITREGYDAIGGHRAVAGSLLEDVALARRLKESGRALLFRYGGEAVSTRMYRSFAQMREGWTKNLALLFPHPILLAVRRTLEFLFLAGAVTMILMSPFTDFLGFIFGLLLLALAWPSFLGRTRRAHFGTLTTELSVLGLPLFAWLLVRSYRRVGRGVEWKGRTYPQSDLTGAEPATEPESRSMELTR